MTAQPLPTQPLAIAASTVSAPDAADAADATTVRSTPKTPATRRTKTPPVPPLPPSGAKSAWTIEDSEELYRISGWGEPYFGINAAGRVTVSPKGARGGSLDLHELVRSLMQRNLELPLLIRFSDILEDRAVECLLCQGDRPLQL
jgi:arginine decarboxylase